MHLLQFANNLAEDGVVAVINTQPHEPFSSERVEALQKAITRTGMQARVKLIHYSKAIEQDPSAPGFWDMWRTMLFNFGIGATDIIVASERYGKKLAQITGTRFFPYDIDRAITPVKATRIRENPLKYFDEIIPEFQQYLQTRITIFGAESTGKTTLSRELAARLKGTWLFEYARPYLEETTNEISPTSMNAIWQGQRALQEHAGQISTSPFIIQDTDLFSTVGYWQFPHWQSTIGPCPEGLVQDAVRLQSDLYIITKSNIPFEADPLRYGGDQREGSDAYWIALCEKFKLPHVVLDSASRDQRLSEAVVLAKKAAQDKVNLLTFDRHNF